MNILLLTPLYKIKGRETLERNTEAIHYLIKYWNEQPNVHVRVVNTYLNPGRNIAFLFKKGELSNYKNDYEYEVDGVPVYMTEVQQIPFQSHLWKFQNQKMVRAVNRVIEKYDFQPDVVIAHFPVRYALMVDKINCSCPKIAVAHTTDTRISRQNPKFWVNKISEGFSRVYCRSRSIQRQCVELGYKNVSEFIISSGVPQADAVRTKKITALQGRKIELLYVGKLIKRKHAEYVIQALNQLKDKVNFNFNIVGVGPEDAALKQLTEKYGLTDRIHFAGSVARDKVYSYMSKADIFIMPSIEETLGLVYLEAMMHGCLTVGTENEGIDGIIEDGKNGFLVKPQSEESVLSVLEKILKLNDQEVADISAKAVETAKYYNEKDMSLRYLDEVKRIVGGNDLK